MSGVLKTVSGKKVRDFCSLLVAGKWKQTLTGLLFFSYIINEYLLGSLNYVAGVYLFFF